jgi:hypothetical protein
MKPTAWLGIRAGPEYRSSTFRAGLERVGFAVQATVRCVPRPGDVVILWNRYGANDRLASDCERRGIRVLVCENGYLGASMPGRPTYAISIGRHNGGGRWVVGGPERWDRLGIELHPWRPAGGETVILAQRGIGSPGVAMPLAWARTVAHLGRVRKSTGYKEHTPLEHDLRAASNVVTWASGAAIRALLWGIPVAHAMPSWIGAPAAMMLPPGARSLPPRRTDDDARLAMFRRLAWAQWNIDEIATGEPFARLLERTA